MNIDITVDSGKYRFTQDDEGHIEIFRHDEPWMSGSFPGVNMVIAMACEIEELRPKAAHVEGLESLRPMWAQGWTSDSEAAQASAAALAQLWEMLQAKNQTEAVQQLQGLLDFHKGTDR